MKSTVPQLFYARTWLHLGGVIVQPSNHSTYFVAGRATGAPPFRLRYSPTYVAVYWNKQLRRSVGLPVRVWEVEVPVELHPYMG